MKTNVIIVPDLDMVLSEARKAGFSVDENLARSTALSRGCRKTYEIETWSPSRIMVSAPELRYHFKNGFAGFSAPFISWLARERPNKPFATPDVPEGAPFTRPGSEGLRNISWDDMSYWENGYSFVAFREAA